MNLIGGIVLVAVAVVALFLFVPVGMVNRDLALCVVGLLVSWLRWLLWLPGLLASGQFSLIGLSNLKRRAFGGPGRREAAGEPRCLAVA